jgi:GcrA cell cycle regulator
MSVWTEERVDVLIALWREGYSASVISARLDGVVSRSAVIGKVHRLGLARHTTSRRKPPRPSPLVAEHKRRTATREQRARARADFDALRRQLDAADRAIPATIMSVIDLEDHHCRYPIGKPATPGFGFCGGQRVPGISYCAAHARRCYALPPLAVAEALRNQTLEPVT